MSPHRRLLAPALLLPALAVAAQVALAPSRAPSALPVARAQPQGPTRYLDLVFDRTTRTNDVVYGTAIDKPTGRAVDLKMDIYEPVGDTAASRPVFVFFFGGGFTQGTKELEPRVYCEQMARRGYVAIAPSYRLNQGDIAKDGIPAAVSDARQAVRWLRANAAAYRLDPTRIVIGGSSAGAITSLFLAYTDVERPAGDDVRGAGSDVALVMDLWGGLYNQVNDLEAGAPPLAIVHGTADNVVPFTEATKLRDRAEAVGVPYVFHPLEGKGHAPYMPVELMTMVAPFLYAQLWPVGAPRMPDLGATDHLAVNYRAESLGQTQAATIDVTRTADGWRGMAGFEVKDWRSERLRTVTSTVPVALSDAAMTAFLTTLARTELTEHLDGPTATATPFDWSATYAFVLSVGGDDIVGLTSHPWTTNPRHERPYVVAIGDHTWRTDDDAPDRALEAIDPALRWDELDRLLRESAATPFVRTATMTAPSATAAPTAVRTVPPEGESGGRVWLPVGMR